MLIQESKHLRGGNSDWAQDPRSTTAALHLSNPERSLTFCLITEDTMLPFTAASHVYSQTALILALASVG